MTAHVNVTTDIPNVTARLRPPRHHAAARNQAIADALELNHRAVELVDRLETLADWHTPSDRQVSSSGQVTPTRSASIPCRCDWPDAPNHDAMLRRICCETPADMYELFELAETWRDVDEAQDRTNVPLIDIEAFAGQHNAPDPRLTYRVVERVRFIYQQHHRTTQAPPEIRARRIVLVDELGDERIILDAASSAVDRGASIEVRSTNPSTSLRFDGNDDGVGVMVSVDDEDVVTLYTNLHHLPGARAAGLSTGSWFIGGASAEWTARPEAGK